MYERTENPDHPFILSRSKYHENLEAKDHTGTVLQNRVKSMSITSTEETVFFTMENNQLMKLNIALDGSDDQMPSFEYVIFNFHSRAVTGLDVCVRKQLLVTCSKDRTVRVWNYHTKSLEIAEQQTDECFAVAFHPSGFHIVVALSDKILMMNVFSKTLKQFKTLQIKGCLEIAFSHGGHLFAAVHQSNIFVYNFWTGELPSSDYQFKLH